MLVGQFLAELHQCPPYLVGQGRGVAVADGIHDAAKGQRVDARAGSEVVGVAQARVDAHARTAFLVALRRFLADLGLRAFS